MQGQLAPCFVQEKLTETHNLLREENELNEDSQQVDVFGVAELVAGYVDCMEEALNYLKDVEQYSDNHPAIVDLREHLALYRTQFLNKTIKNSSEPSLRLLSSS